MRTAFSAFAAFSLLAGCGSPGEMPANDSSEQAEANQAGATNAADNAIAETPAEPAVAAAIPEAFRGTYDESEQDCGRPTDTRLIVEAGQIRYHESIGTVRSVKVIAPDRIELFADYEGEGETWQNVRTFALDGRRLTISGEGTETVTIRCPDSAPKG